PSRLCAEPCATSTTPAATPRSCGASTRPSLRQQPKRETNMDTQPSPTDVLLSMGDHVAKYGPTGGNPDYMAAPVCPRGLVLHFAEGRRWDWRAHHDAQRDTVRGEVLAALDRTVPDGWHNWHKGYIEGRNAERYWTYLAVVPGGTKRALAHIEAALREVERP